MQSDKIKNMDNSYNCSQIKYLLDKMIFEEKNASAAHPEEDQNVGDPGIYIISVLLFYSCGIVILMISYMQSNTSESEDYYVKYLEQTRMTQEESSNRGRGLNKLALQALNAVNVIQDKQKVTYV